uniref:ShKT domain-containing protein n=1 Tax=Haemonchus contortus TaxID=6289 RepID=A0A7I5E9H5_HAECO|nr:Metridin ShK toxin domain containing protein [Haemonchus contortus]
MAYLFVLLLVATVSGKSLDLTKVNVDGLPSDAQKPVFPGAPSDEADDEYFDEEDSDTFEEEDGELPNEVTDKSSHETNDEPSDEATPTESVVTKATKEAPKCVDKPNCKSLAREGFCKMNFPDRIKKASCPIACNLCD